MLPLPGGAGVSPVIGNAHRLADYTLPAGTFKRFDLEQVVRLLLDVLSGLAALHEVSSDGEAFVHGGASPQNIYIDEHGTARLVPLLNVHLHGSVKPEETGYAAPELLLGDAVDARADVFSVGVMLWEALAGKRLFPDPSVQGVMARALGRKVPAISLSARLRWAQPLCAIAERAIAVEPAARFRSALELSLAMAAAAAQQLSRVETDAWQEEAPTPVFQPKLHLATLRASTPPPAVLTITPSEAPVPSVVASVAPAAELVATPDVPEPRSARRRGRFVGAVLLTAALGGAAFGLPKLGVSARSFSALTQLLPARARVAASLAPTKGVELSQPAAGKIATLPQPAPPITSVVSPAPPPIASVVSPALVSDSEKTGAAASAAASARPPAARPNQPLGVPAAAAKPKLKSGARANDYGI